MSVASSVIIGGASPDHARAEADFYPTPPECTEALALAFPELFGSLCWEPACGDGAISRVLNARGVKTYDTDLRQTGFGRGGVNALTHRPEGISSIVTNPPFNLAEQFIRHARAFNVPFAMLLKSTYWHAASRQALWRDTGPAAVCPMLWRPNFAPERGKSPTMDVCWTVWDAQPATVCVYHLLPKPLSTMTTDEGDIFQ